MQTCSITDKIRIFPASPADYGTLACYHYRHARPGPVSAVYALRPKSRLPGLTRSDSVGIIVYSMPVPALKLRNYATLSMFTGLDRQTQLQLINANIRCISRIIIEPRFRSLGLATRLVEETMPLLDVPIIEAMAVMGTFTGFFEKAGMTAYTRPSSKRHVRMIEAFSGVGIEQDELINPKHVHERIENLDLPEAAFIEREILLFIESYPHQRKAPPSLDRTRFIITKLTTQPVYYIWFNNKVPLKTTKEIK